MKKLIVRVLLLAVAVTAVILIHRRVEYEAEQAELATAQTVETESVLAVEVQEQSNLRAGKDVVLGSMEENTERGGVNITVAAEDGTEKVYTFTDVTMDSWFANAVNYVVSAGLMNGIADRDIFQPDYGMPRESFAMVLYRFANAEPAEKHCGLEDVERDAWYEEAVDWVVSKGCMSPLSDGRFGVGEFMTCEEAIIGIYHLAGEPEVDGSLADYPYAARVSDSGRSAVDWAWKNGMINEDECVWYPPQAISRAQIALLLTRFSEKIS